MLRIVSVSLDGMILQVGAPIAAGLWMVSEVRHPSLGAPFSTQVRVAWCQFMQNVPQPFVGLEFTGGWGELLSLRRRLAAILGSKAYDEDDRPQGYVILDPREAACFDMQTAKIAVLGFDGQGYVVRQRGGVVSVKTFQAAVKHAFSLTKSPRLDPPIQIEGESASDSGEDLGDPFEGMQGAPSPDEEEILGAQTMVLKPERAEALSDEEIFGANTLVLKPEGMSDEDVLSSSSRITSSKLETGGEAGDGDDTLVLPGRKKKRGTGRFKKKKNSRVIGPDDTVVGFICPSNPGAWTLYNGKGDKVAMLMEGDGAFRCVMLGKSEGDDLTFYEEDTCLAALARAFQIEGTPDVQPPLAGVNA